MRTRLLTSLLVFAACAPPATTDVRDASTSADASVDAGTEVPVVDTLELRIFALPTNTPQGAQVYAAGSFNAWNPADSKAIAIPGAEGVRTLKLGPITPGTLVEFKITRGAWASVEKDEDGGEVADRRVTFDPAHPVVAIAVERWADLPAPASTARGHLDVVPDLAVPGLARSRAIRVSLPPGYEGGTARHPVLYVWDGQNLFDRATSAFGHEWRFDETVARLVLEGRLPPVIVVGLDNSAARPCEYNVFAADPHPSCADGSAQGDAFVTWLVGTVKPLVDARYRTAPDRAHTGVAGSSMGGHLALRAAIAHQDVFSRVAALSPSFQNKPGAPISMPAWIRETGRSADVRVHLDMGSVEQIRDLPAATLVANLKLVQGALEDAGFETRALVVDGAIHDERAWAARLGEVLEWIWR